MQVVCNGFRLIMFFCVYVRISFWGVDKGDDRYFKVFSYLYQMQCFVVIFWCWYIKVMVNFFFGFMIFLMINDYYWMIIEMGDIIDDSFIVCICVVVSQFVKFIKCQVNVIQGIRMLWMVCQLCNLLCIEIGEDFMCQFYVFFMQMMYFFIDVNIQFFILMVNCSQRIDFCFQFCNWLFKIKEIQIYSIFVLVKFQFYLF